VVILHIWEVVDGVGSSKLTQPRKQKTASKKTDWEKNLSKLRSRERELDAQKPVKPVNAS
jgi:hypothetical protein